MKKITWLRQNHNNNKKHQVVIWLKAGWMSVYQDTDGDWISSITCNGQIFTDIHASKSEAKQHCFAERKNHLNDANWKILSTNIR